jgi:predicted amidohydrolase YtcJ|tara:strand:+ start:1809 stop:3206 length:1398 start_codon:yes stop_codon:yes gene_type:complete
VLLIRHAGIEGHAGLDVRCTNGVVTQIAAGLTANPGEKVIDAASGALLPGLHDHHMHLFALTAARQSVHCGPPAVTNTEALREVLLQQKGSGWIRGVGYHESVAGMLQRSQLDAILPTRPVRIQHRSGKMWFVNSVAAEILNLHQHLSLDGVECDSNNAPTGRLFRMDDWLRQQLVQEPLPDIESTSKLLATFGVSGFTDATHTNSSAARYRQLIEDRQLLQRVRVMGDESLTVTEHPQLELGAVKIMLDEYALPEFDALKLRIVTAHQQMRCVAIHCVTVAELVLALTACREAGPMQGDRIEHASLTPDDCLSLFRESGVTVVTQPNLIAERGDQYLVDIDSSQHDMLYRSAAFLRAGVPLGAGSDAPFGNADPWLSMSAAVNRLTAAGRLIGAEERLTPEQALRLFTSPADDPGGPARTIQVGSAADFCLLDRPWKEARVRLQRTDVAATVRGGEVIYQRSPP